MEKSIHELHEKAGPLQDKNCPLPQPRANCQLIAMYRPNFCAQCGQKVLRLTWHVWTSRKFCDDCGRVLRKERLGPWLLAVATLSGGGYVAGRARTPAPPPLTIIRRADSPLTSPEDPGPVQSGLTDSSKGVPTTMTPEADVYLCGALTKKGTPCSRRVHGPVRCWQHKGARAMPPQEKLLIKE